VDRVTPCEHPDFRANVAVARLAEREGGSVVRFSADVKIECAKCGEPFRFIGVGAGVSFQGPCVSIDGLELRAPIQPQGHPQLATKATFEMPPRES